MMSQPPSRRSVFHQVLSVLKHKASGQAKQQTLALQRPAPDDHDAWRAYWKAQGQPWRTEPEIDAVRQAELARRHDIVPDMEKGIYPFKGMKLSRVDVEWLLATYGKGFTPEKGLDVRGADLNGADLSGLPLNELRGGLAGDEWMKASEEQRKIAAAQMININLREAQLQNAQLRNVDFSGAQFQGAQLQNAQLQGAYLSKVQLQNANLNGAQLQAAYLNRAQLQHASLIDARLQGADLSKAQLQNANLFTAQLENAVLSEAQLENAVLREAQLQNADLSRVQLQNANLFNAHLENAVLNEARLQGADLRTAHLEGAHLHAAQCQNANLSGSQLQGAALNECILADPLGISPQLVDVHWDGLILAVVDWSQVKILGDEYKARQRTNGDGIAKDREQRLSEHRVAVRANRQLAVALQDQGLNEDASRFAYRANLLQRKVLWFQMVQPSISPWQRVRKLGAWGFSHLLNVTAGYGYRPERSFLAYLFVISGFATAYYLLGLHDIVGPHHVFGAYHLTWDEAVVVSMTAFHGRGFFANQFQPGDPQAFVAAFEAFVGLIIEVTFIATLTRRFFGQ